MNFGAVRLDEAEGAVLAHSVALDKGRLKKGRVLTAEDVAKLHDSGLSEVVVARLGPGDIGEDEAAKAIEDTVISVTREKIKDLGAGRMGYSTTEVGDLIASSL